MTEQMSLFSVQIMLQMEDAHLEAGVKESAGQLPFAWRAPWLLADGQVMVYHVAAGMGCWCITDQTSEMATRYQYVLGVYERIGSLLLERERLTEFLRSQQREQFVRDVLAEAIAVLRQERVYGG